MNAYEKEVDEKEFEEMLNENYDTVKVMGMEYGQGTALKELDPIAFRCAMADEPVVWVCSECSAEFPEADHGGDAEEFANECCF